MGLIRWIKNNKQWIFSGIGVVILVFFVRHWRYFRSNIGFYLRAIVSQIKQNSIVLWNHLISQFSMPYWLLYILLICSSSSLILVILKLIKIVQNHKNERIYTEDVFEEAVWRWDKLTNKGIEDLRPFCPRCDTELILHTNIRYNDQLYCDGCKKSITETSGEESVKRQIEARFSTGDSTGDWIHSHIRLGKLYYQSEKYDKAIDYFKKALISDPHNAEVYHFLGKIYINKEEYDLAISIYREATDAILKSDQKGAFHYMLATLYSHTNKNDLAITELRKAIDLNSQCIEEAKTFSMFDNIREMPEFQQLINSVE